MSVVVVAESDLLWDIEFVMNYFTEIRLLH